MARVVVGFLVGYAVGFAGLWGLCAVAARAIEGESTTAATARGISVAEYRQWYEARYGTMTVIASQVGGVACALLCGLAGTQTGSVSARRRAGEPLSREETRMAIASCLWADVTGREPEYVRGLIVGRLAESEPDVARKVDRLGRAQLLALYEKVQARKEANVV
jgi:hypothetical protein